MTTETPEQINAMSATEVIALYDTKRAEIYAGHGKFGMWDFTASERKDRITELEKLADAHSRKLAERRHR